jgi:hypothetical protein
MIWNAEIFATWEPLARRSCPTNSQRKLSDAIMRDSHFRKNTKPRVSVKSSPASKRRATVVRSASVSGTKKHEPENAEDQDGKSRGNRQEREHRRPRLCLPCFGRGFDDLTLLSRCHGGLDF